MLGLWESIAWAAVATGLSVSPFGSLAEKVADRDVWTGFDADDAVLLVMRVDRITAKSSASCDQWLSAANQAQAGVDVPPGLPGEIRGWEPQGWFPMKDEERDAVLDCVKFPCAVKLAQPEVMQVAKAPKEERMKAFLVRVRARLEAYLGPGQPRLGYEFPGAPVDPWALFEKHGLVAWNARPAKPEITARKLDLAPGKMRELRQLLDVRRAMKQGESVLWVRDLYTNHYFDSWGEWLSVSCQPADGTFLVTQALLVEFDLLKQNDLVSRLSRTTLRTAVKDQGGLFLKHRFEELSERVEKMPAGSPSPAPTGSGKPPAPRSRL